MTTSRGEDYPKEDQPWSDDAFRPFAVESVMAGERFRSCMAFMEKNGVSANHFLLSATPLQSNSQQIMGAIVNLVDITEKIALEQRLKQSEEWLATTLRSIGDGVIATDEQGRIAFMNPTAEELTGWRFDEVMEEALGTVFNVVNEETRRPCENPVKKVLETGRVIGLDNHTLLIHKGGEEIPIKESGPPIRLTDGETIGVVLVFQDDRKDRASQQRLAKEQARLKRILDTFPNGIYIAGPRRWRHSAPWPGAFWR